MIELTTHVAKRKKQLLAEEVFEHIGTSIVNGELQPGERIRDAEIAMELHVSRMPVREALQRLERLGLVTMQPSRFTEVSEVTDALMRQTLEFAGFHAGIVARLAVSRMTLEDRTEVAGRVDALIDAIDDSVETSVARWQLFSFLSDRSRNELQRNVVNESGMALLRNLRDWHVPPDDRDEMLAIYADFKAAVADGDANGSERLARAMHYVA